MSTFAEIVRARVTDGHVGIRFGDQQRVWKEAVREAAHRAASLPVASAGGRSLHLGLENTSDSIFCTCAATLFSAAIGGINPTRREVELVRENSSDGPVEPILENHPDVAVAPGHAVPDPCTWDQGMCTIQLPPCVTFTRDGSRVFSDSRADLGTRWRTGSDLTYRLRGETELIQLNDEFAEHGRTMLFAAV